MTEMAFVESSEWTLAPDVLVRTETGGRLHIAACPHIGGMIRLATDEERGAMTVCTWCQAELDGVGRTYFDQLEEVMREFGTWSGTEKLIKAALHGVDWDSIWVPNSRSYVALGHQGKGVAWFGKSYVVPARGEFVWLPEYQEGHGGPRGNERTGEVCAKHFMARSVTGRCDMCDD
jgi:hypothetical protein